MTKQHPNTGQDQPKTAKRRRVREQYEPEIVYQYWAAAGGKVLEAMRLAEGAGEDRVPSNRHTWAEYALQHKFAERLKEDEEKKWALFHEEREKNQQPLLDKMARAFELIGDAFYQTIERDYAALRGDDVQAFKQAQKRLDKMFGSADAFDRIYRMYFRARNLPERLTQQTVKTSPNAVGYEEFEEEDTRAKTIEEARSRKAAKEPL